MGKSKAIPFAVLCGALAGCNPTTDDTPVPFTISHVAESALSSFFVADWAPFEAAASALRLLDDRYTVQQVNWSQGQSNSLAHGRVEYAHAAGLTGAGQLISIVDAGFLTSHDEFAGKTISTPGGQNNPGVDDHGTSVASIAAGMANSGDMIGVAPGADLQLGSFNTFSSITAANNQAIAMGAIVQNNSWGYEVDANTANYSALFGGSSGSAYLTSINNLADNTVIVFAASNDTSRTTSDLMAALPMLAPGLQNSWITVINAVPTFSGETITSANIVSSHCLEAAAWCMMADGTVYSAVSSGDSDYDYGTGSSFAAPQVAGSIALLAEAFPALNAEELRARLLASSDNNFFGHTGYVEFAPGVQHGYSTSYGHGFLNMKAALSPIGGSYLPLSNGGAVSLESPIVLSGGMSGDALVSGLAEHDVAIVDGMGAGFDVSAGILSASALVEHDPVTSISDLLSASLNDGSIDPFQSFSQFSQYVSGQELNLLQQETNFSLLVPEGPTGSYGLSASRAMDIFGSEFRLGLSAMHESDGFVGLQSLLPGQSLAGTHGAASFELAVPMAMSQELQLTGKIGVAVPAGQVGDMSMSTVAYNALGVSYGARNVMGRGDRLTAGLGLPDAISSGSASVMLPITRADGSFGYSSVDIPLTAASRQMDLSITYGVPLSGQSEVIMSAVRSLNDANVTGQNVTEAAIGFKFNF